MFMQEIEYVYNIIKGFLKLASIHYKQRYDNVDKVVHVELHSIIFGKEIAVSYFFHAFPLIIIIWDKCILTGQVLIKQRKNEGSTNQHEGRGKHSELCFQLAQVS